MICEEFPSHIAAISFLDVESFELGTLGPVVPVLAAACQLVQSGM